MEELEFVDFTGEENELEFLKKCMKQWEITANAVIPNVFKMSQLGTVFHEIRHRINEMEE